MNAHNTMLQADDRARQTELESQLESEKAPIHIGSVTLNARNADALAAFYQDIIGLDIITRESDRISLGSGGVPYLDLIASPDAREPKQPAAGLFHNAFLLPSRAALGAWFTAARDRGAPIEAASDHHVSEAFYLTDPEGNGIEVYADRDRSQWRKSGNEYLMTTGRMDVRAVADAGFKLGAGHGRFPASSRIGHVHLSVGDVAAAERFYHSCLGLDITHKRPGGSFFSSGGYHHHIAANTWHSLGACLREEGTLGLAKIELLVKDEGIMNGILQSLEADGAMMTGNARAAEDPWGTTLTFTPSY